MASRTDSSAKVARSRLDPYERKSSKTSPRARTQSITPPFTPPVSQKPVSPVSSLPSGTRREHYVRMSKRFHPNIVPRHDWDIVVLACGTYKEGDFYEHSDSLFEPQHCRFTKEQVKDGSAKAQLLREATGFLDTRDTPTGMKPLPGEEDVHIRPIPSSQYSLRMWGKGLEEKHQFCLDFVLTATGEPVNSPTNHELWVVPKRSTPWLPAGKSHLHSLERSFGVAQEDILPGEEKFLLLEGTACMLKRPGMRPVYFEAPVRPRPSVEVDARNFDVLTFG